jgi:hypothetical protein
MLAQEKPRAIALGIDSRLVRDQADALASQNCVITLLENIDAQLNCPIGCPRNRQESDREDDLSFIAPPDHRI